MAFYDSNSSNRIVHLVMELITSSPPLPLILYQTIHLFRHGSAVISVTRIEETCFWLRWPNESGDHMVGLYMKIYSTSVSGFAGYEAIVRPERRLLGLCIGRADSAHITQSALL